MLAQLKNKDENRETTSHHMKKGSYVLLNRYTKQKEDIDHGSIAKIGFRNII